MVKRGVDLVSVMTLSFLVIAACSGHSGSPVKPASSPTPMSAKTTVASPATTTGSVPPIIATCIVGYEQPKPDPDLLPTEVSSADYTHSTFKTGAPIGINFEGAYWAPTMAYKLSVTNNSGQVITVEEFTAAAAV